MMNNESSQKNHIAIEAKDLKKSFGNFDALRGINLEVKNGEFFTIFGPNGAGKTTLIKIFSTLTNQTSGELKIYGFDSVNESQKIRSIIGVISHDTYLYENLTALENIKFFSELYGLTEIDKLARSVISEVGLHSRMNDLVRTFSRGMKQRLTVARALVNKPQMLLLDEPYTGLDQHGATLFGEMLYNLKQQNRTIIMTTHNIQEGLDLSDRVSILVKGKLVYESLSKDIDHDSFRSIYLSSVKGK